MKKALILLLFSISSFAQKQVAITVDDLPFVMERSLVDAQTATTKFIQSLDRHNVKAVAFVNEQFILNFGTVDARTEILNQWVKAGHELGNHTFSHPSFNETSLEEYIEDFIRGEAISKKINGNPLRYFRHPYLHTGNDSLKRYGFDAFLEKRNYQIAPVTVDSYDWYYNKVYVEALKAGNSKLAEEIGKEYVEHSIKCFRYFDELSKEQLGRSVKHIFLCHANRINADYIDEVFTQLKKEKYEFITLEEALKDEAYRLPVSIETSRGVWLHRWRVTQKKQTSLISPKLSEKVTKLFEKNNR